jgi:SET domain-containing protein
MEIHPPTKVFVATSPISGLGVFAKERIAKDELIEICPVLALPLQPGETSSLFIDYRFNYPSGTGDKWSEQVISLGYGSLYNHSNNNNAVWYSDEALRVFRFVAIRDIEPGEEICTYYGSSEAYWADGRTHTDVR